MEAFAQEYYRQGKGQHPFVDADAAFILAFSIIMLNTDLHNPQVSIVRKRSTSAIS
jgi:Sec7-like guanine-nucleotide exchange factor